MPPDITECKRAEQGIARGMNDDVAVRMRDEATLVFHAHPSEHDVIARSECMNVYTLADAHFFGGIGNRESGIGKATASPLPRKGLGLLAACEAGSIAVRENSVCGSAPTTPDSPLPIPCSEDTPPTQDRPQWSP
jgi:hypothetical protein